MNEKATCSCPCQTHCLPEKEELHPARCSCYPHTQEESAGSCMARYAVSSVQVQGLAVTGTIQSVFLFCKRIASGWKEGAKLVHRALVEGTHCLCMQLELFALQWDRQSVSQKKGVALLQLAYSGHFSCHGWKGSKANFTGRRSEHGLSSPGFASTGFLQAEQLRRRLCDFPASQNKDS